MMEENYLLGEDKTEGEEKWGTEVVQTLFT